jgi:hypothetical protein
MAEPKYITLKEAFEHSDYSLEPLFKAAEAWFPNKKHTEAMGPRFAFAESLGFQPLKDERSLQLAYEREREAATAHFRRLLATGAWAIEIWSGGVLDGAWRPPRPDLASRLRIEVDDPAAKSISLHRPDGKELDCRLSRAAAAEAEPAVDPYRTGAAGPRTISHLVLAEAERRLKDGRPCAWLKDFAAELEQWGKTNHPAGPPLQAGRIENLVRNRWQDAAAKPTSPPTN